MSAVMHLLRELLALFVDDGSLALAILTIVGIAGALSVAFPLSSFVTGSFLVVGCVAALLENVLRASRTG